jgi:hypothetical protein
VIVERFEDMSPTGRLRLLRQEDGDIVVVVIDGDGDFSSVEFCTPMSGGGQSSRSHPQGPSCFDAGNGSGRIRPSTGNTAWSKYREWGRRPTKGTGSEYCLGDNGIKENDEYSGGDDRADVRRTNHPYAEA